MLFWPEIAVMPAWYIMHVLWVSYNTRASRSTSLPFLTSFFVTLCATVAAPTISTMLLSWSPSSPMSEAVVNMPVEEFWWFLVAWYGVNFFPGDWIYRLLSTPLFKCALGVAEALLAVSLTYATFGKAYLLNPESMTYVVLVAALQGSGNALVTAADRKTILRTVLAPQTQFWFHVVFASTLYTISYSGAMSLDTVSGLFCIAACILYPVLMMIESPEDQENAVKMRTLGDPNAFLEEENAKRVYNETLFSLIAVRYDLGQS